MPPIERGPSSVGWPNFDPDIFIQDWNNTLIPTSKDKSFEECIKRAFGLKNKDHYVYHAIASVTLEQVQSAIKVGSRNGMHAWYRDEEGKQIEAPSQADIEAYTQIFSPKTASVSALNSLASNAKRGSIRASIGEHLKSHLHLPGTSTGLILPAKQKNPKTVFINPYYDLWAWSCRDLEWAGPNGSTVNIKQSHHILPVFYHHFGCVCPTWDSMSLIQKLAKSKMGAKSIVEIGSGNGYWAYLLRRLGLTVQAVDNAVSEWRTNWIGDTIIADGVMFLKNPPTNLQGPELGGPGCPNAILLLVYPQVSANLTASLLHEFKGSIIIVAGTQNLNGYTGFKDETIGQWMAREKPMFQKAVQIPLPSFAAKDEALFIFTLKEIY